MCSRSFIISRANRQQMKTQRCACCASSLKPDNIDESAFHTVQQRPILTLQRL